MPCERKRWDNMQVEINKQNQYFKWFEAVTMLPWKISVKISTHFMASQRIEWNLSLWWNPELSGSNVCHLKAGVSCIFKQDPCCYPAFTFEVIIPLSSNFRHRLKPRRPLRNSSGRWRSCGQPRRPSPWLRRGCWRRTAVSLTPPGRKCSTMPHRG